MLRNFEEIDKLGYKDKGKIKDILDTFILKTNSKDWLFRKKFKVGEGQMNKEAIAKHDIYHKLSGFSEQDLYAIVNFIDFMRQKKKLEEKKVIKLEGILKGYDIDISDLKKFKEETWKHVDEESING